MTNGSIVGKLIRFSGPLIFSGILQLLFNAADIVVVGRFAGDNSLAAVGSTSSLINLLVNLFVGLSVGTNVVAVFNDPVQTDFVIFIRVTSEERTQLECLQDSIWVMTMDFINQ